MEITKIYLIIFFSLTGKICRYSDDFMYRLTHLNPINDRYNYYTVNDEIRIINNPSYPVK